VEELALDVGDELVERDALLVADPDEGQPGPAARSLVLNRELVGLRSADLENLGGLLDRQEGREVVEHG